MNRFSVVNTWCNRYLPCATKDSLGLSPFCELLETNIFLSFVHSFLKRSIISMKYWGGDDDDKLYFFLIFGPIPHYSWSLSPSWCCHLFFFLLPFTNFTGWSILPVNGGRSKCTIVKLYFAGMYFASSSEIVGSRGLLKVGLFGSSTGIMSGNNCF